MSEEKFLAQQENSPPFSCTFFMLHPFSLSLTRRSLIYTVTKTHKKCCFILPHFHPVHSHKQRNKDKRGNKKKLWNFFLSQFSFRLLLGLLFLAYLPSLKLLDFSLETFFLPSLPRETSRKKSSQNFVVIVKIKVETFQRISFDRNC